MKFLAGMAVPADTLVPRHAHPHSRPVFACLQYKLSVLAFMQAPNCEHAFCGGCIKEWLTRQPTCPVDRGAITPNQLKPVPRILRNLLSRLEITCDNAGFGCTAVLKLDLLPSHLQVS